MRVIIRVVVAVMAVLAGTPVQAQVNVPVGRWIVDYGDIRCSLGRRIGGEGSPIVIITTPMGRGSTEFRILRDREALPRFPQQVEIVLQPSGSRSPVEIAPRRGAGPEVQIVTGLPEDFIERVASASSIRIEGGREAVDLPLPQANEAVAALRACNDDLLRSWGIDTALEATYTRRATMIAGSIRDSDYPAFAWQRAMRGAVVVVYTVGTDGRATDCRPVVRSGASVLDAQTCSMIVERFRFEPALDAQGNPVSVRRTQRVTYRL